MTSVVIVSLRGPTKTSYRLRRCDIITQHNRAQRTSSRPFRSSRTPRNNPRTADIYIAFFYDCVSNRAVSHRGARAGYKSKYTNVSAFVCTACSLLPFVHRRPFESFTDSIYLAMLCPTKTWNTLFGYQLGMRRSYPTHPGIPTVFAGSHPRFFLTLTVDVLMGINSVYGVNESPGARSRNLCASVASCCSNTSAGGHALEPTRVNSRLL